jgi:dihydroorotate dehydrogenase
MITLSNGVRFSCISSSGSRGWAGNDEGHGLVRPWKWFWDAVGCFPSIPVVAKTTTRYSRKGNLTFWRPWRAVRLFGTSSMVNAVALTNPSERVWVQKWYTVAISQPFPVFASIAPDDPTEAGDMALLLQTECPDLPGIELNLSCPNSGHLNTQEGNAKLAKALAIFYEVKAHTRHPIIVKLGYQDDFLTLCRLLQRDTAAFHLINALPVSVYRQLHPEATSPLAPYGYEGAISGHLLAPYAREVLTKVKQLNLPMPIISGGGIMTAEEAELRFSLGAQAIALGSVFLLRPWRVASIVRACHVHAC